MNLGNETPKGGVKNVDAFDTYFSLSVVSRFLQVDW